MSTDAIRVGTWAQPTIRRAKRTTRDTSLQRNLPQPQLPHRLNAPAVDGGWTVVAETGPGERRCPTQGGAVCPQSFSRYPKGEHERAHDPHPEKDREANRRVLAGRNYRKHSRHGRSHEGAPDCEKKLGGGAPEP